MDDRVGDQHKTNGSTSVNPFEETKPRLSEYTAQEIASLQSRLDKQLGPEYISSRPGAAGQKVHYLTAEKVISLANEVFGFNGWSSAIQNIQIDYVDENTQTGKVSLGLSVIVRVTLKDGTFHEDIGYGLIENCKGKGAAFKKAKKEGTTDALKRALRNFGNVLGNCIYDKDFLGRVTKIKVAPPKWDADNLHRHPGHASIKQKAPREEESTKQNGDSSLTSNTEFEDDFGVADFDDADFGESHTGHPDEIVLPVDSLNYQQRFSSSRQSGYDQLSTNAAPSPRIGVTASSRPQQQFRPSMQPAGGSRSVTSLPINNPNFTRMQPPPMTNQQTAPSRHLTQTLPSDGPHQQQPSVNNHSSSPSGPPKHLAANAQQIPPPYPAQHVPPVAFYSARAATVLNPESNDKLPPAPPNIPQFNPNAESPSIRKTAGIDHSKSIPVKRGLRAVDTSAPPPYRGGTHIGGGFARDFVNPSADMHRRIGAPEGMQSPAAKGGVTVSAYRPPTKRGPDPDMAMNTNGTVAGTAIGKRSPLNDVSNMQYPVTTSNAGDGPEAKRQRVDPPESGASGNSLSGVR